jgi:hypothetical protein
MVQILFFVNALAWLLLGVVNLARVAGNGTGQMLAMVVIAILMFGNAAAMLVCGVGLGTRQRRFYFLALAVLAVNLILTVTDQFGLLDLLTLLLDVALLGLLVWDRKSYAPLSRTAGLLK